MTFSDKDQLCQYLVSGYVHLSKKDYSFFHNVIVQTKDTKPVTSNQNNLFNKLLHKYKRQLTRLNHNVDNLVELEWRSGVVESKKEFLQAKIYVLGNDLIIKSPFNSQFVQQFRRVILNPFIWDTKEKFYIAELSTYSLKTAYIYVTKYYKDVVFCPTVQKLLDQTVPYNDAKYWTPTLVKTNNNFFIYSTNSILNQHIQDIVLNDDPNTLFLLSQYGVSVDTSVTQDNETLNFAGTYKVSCDLDDLDAIVDMLHLLKVTHVFTARDVVYNKSVSNEIKTKLLSKGITCSPISNNTNATGVFITTSSYESINGDFQKIIRLTNSRPILIKNI